MYLRTVSKLCAELKYVLYIDSRTLCSDLPSALHNGQKSPKHHHVHFSKYFFLVVAETSHKTPDYQHQVKQLTAHALSSRQGLKVEFYGYVQNRFKICHDSTSCSSPLSLIIRNLPTCPILICALIFSELSK